MQAREATTYEEAEELIYELSQAKEYERLRRWREEVGANELLRREDALDSIQLICEFLCRHKDRATDDRVLELLEQAEDLRDKLRQWAYNIR